VEHRIGLTREIWHNSIKKFEEPGVRFQKIRSVFDAGFTAYSRAAAILPKYVGGIYHSRLHVGNDSGLLPFQVVPAAEQRRAVETLSRVLFAADAFDLPAELLNKLPGENMSDFSGSVYSRPTVDYPIHSRILTYQNRALARLYHPYILRRLVNNLARVSDEQDRYTMYEMFQDFRRAIWGEIVGPENVNSFRRQLQLLHLTRLIAIYLSNAASFPLDARTLAANDLDILESAAQKAVASSAINNMTKAHFREVIRQIKAAKATPRSYIGL